MKNQHQTMENKIGNWISDFGQWAIHIGQGKTKFDFGKPTSENYIGQ